MPAVSVCIISSCEPSGSRVTLSLQRGYTRTAHMLGILESMDTDTPLYRTRSAMILLADMVVITGCTKQVAITRTIPPRGERN